MKKLPPFPWYLDLLGLVTTALCVYFGARAHVGGRDALSFGCAAFGLLVAIRTSGAR